MKIKDENSKIFWVESENIKLYLNDYQELSSNESRYADIQFDLISISWTIKCESKIEYMNKESNSIDFWQDL